MALALIALPGWPIIIGFFPMMADLQLLDAKFGLVLLLFTYRIQFKMWFMTGYFRMVPSEIEDAARVDGCTPLQALYHIVIFMVQPAFIAVSITSFLHGWNFFLLPLIVVLLLQRYVVKGLSAGDIE